MLSFVHTAMSIATGLLVVIVITVFLFKKSN